MKTKPDLFWKMRAADERKKRNAAEAHNASLQYQLERERSNVSYWIDRNAHLWAVLMKLPGGVEAARERGVTK